MPFNRRTYPADAIVGLTEARDGWPLRTYRQPAIGDACGSILWLGGRGDIFEKYLEAFDHWSKGGWSVTSFDWRGQGGSGRLSSNPTVGHIDDFATWIDDLADFYRDWSGDQLGPHVVMGHSMGGHLLLRALAEKRIAPDRAVLIAPMLGFDTGLLPFAMGSAFANLMSKLSRPHRHAWKENEKPAAGDTKRETFLTRDSDRYSDEVWWKKAVPGLALGPPSWGWMAAAYASLARLRKFGAVEAIELPVLLIGTDGDALVSPSAIRSFAARLPHAQLKMFGKEVAHEVLRERDEVRDEALALIDGFIRFPTT